jgi:hypothetical protein
MGPKGVPETKTDRPTDRRSQHQFKFLSLKIKLVLGLTVSRSVGQFILGPTTRCGFIDYRTPSLAKGVGL